jgi:hypothetical protein
MNALDKGLFGFLITCRTLRRRLDGQALTGTKQNQNPRQDKRLKGKGMVFFQRKFLPILLKLS